MKKAKTAKKAKVVKLKTFYQISPEEQIERWEQLDRVLKELPPHVKRKHFDMGTWGHRTECGTVACAAGHAGMDPWFKRRGLKLTLVKGLSGHWVALQHFEDDAYRFFGAEGYFTILTVGGVKTVAAVRKDIRHHIKWLREMGGEKNPEAIF